MTAPLPYRHAEVVAPEVRAVARVSTPRSARAIISPAVASLGQRALDARGVAYVSHEYDYRKKGAIAAAEALRAELGALLKTLVVRLADGSFVLLLVPGDCDASMRELARHLGVKDAELASERDAERVTGYLVGYLRTRARSPNKRAP